MNDSALPSVIGEFAGARLPDRRLVCRLRKVVAAVAAKPRATFPRVVGHWSELTGFYRFVRNPRVRYNALMDPHFRETASRAAKHAEVLVLHDTTPMHFEHADPELVGYLQTGKAGFYAHFSMAVTADGTRRPVGIIGFEEISRNKRRKHRRLTSHQCARLKDRESGRWFRGVQAAEERLSGRTKAIHVMDREGDSYELIANMLQHQRRFTVRVSRDRSARPEEAEPDAVWGSLHALAGAVEHVCEREVPLTRRKGGGAPNAAKRHPSRDARLATLRFSSAEIVIRRPRTLPADRAPETLSVNVVRAYEVDAPAGQDPVEWMLLTTERIDTEAAILRVVDIYRTRWLIEEYFKALKTGCRYEERQLESRDALLNALALFIPIAWRSLLLRNVARTRPDESASEVLSGDELDVLRRFSSRKPGPNPTIRDALWSVAALGGHLKNNGEPGWLTLQRGLRELSLLTAGWTAALQGRHEDVING